MLENMDALAKAKARSLKKVIAERQAIERRRKEEGRIRKLEAQDEFRRAVVIGTNIRDKWGSLSVAARREISELLESAVLSDADQAKLAGYLPAKESPQQGIETLEFVPSRPKGEKLDEAAE
jgi:hypothetical protein